VDSIIPTTTSENQRPARDETIPFVKVPAAKVGVTGKIQEIARRNRAKGRASYEGLVVDGRYRLSFLIGRGGMSVVYLARCLETGRHVAIKFLRPELVDRSPYRQRFINEIEAIRRIRHPVIVRMFGIGELEDGRIYLVARRSSASSSRGTSRSRSCSRSRRRSPTASARRTRTA
jgi:serine/threonine protein kinase